jgi:glutamate N-acetyltransferase/amino-acid N-acetyltransferase
VYAGLRAAGKKADLSLVVADEPATAAGVFTLNVMCAAPVTYCKDVLAKRDSVKAVRGAGWGEVHCRQLAARREL